MAEQRVDRTERLLNLVFALMASRVPMHRSVIAATVPGYAPDANPAALERMFERDKDELRSMGIPVETVLDANGDVAGYVIKPETYSMVDVSFTAAEIAAVTVAANTWGQAALASKALTAVRKLEALQADVPSVPLSDSMALLNPSDAHLMPLLSALRSRSSVQFRYQAPGAEPVERSLEPWGVMVRDGAWYAAGFDTQRQAPRVFRLSRMLSAPQMTGPATQPRPELLDVNALLESAAGPDEQITATVRATPRRAAEMRTHANVDAQVEQFTVQYRSVAELVAAVLGAGQWVQVLEPAVVVEQVQAALERILETHTVGA